MKKILFLISSFYIVQGQAAGCQAVKMSLTKTTSEKFYILSQANVHIATVRGRPVEPKEKDSVLLIHTFNYNNGTVGEELSAKELASILNRNLIFSKGLAEGNLLYECSSF